MAVRFQTGETGSRKEVEQLPTYVFDCCMCVRGMHMFSFLVEKEGTNPQMSYVDIRSLYTPL